MTSILEQLHNDIAAADSTLRGSLLLTTVSGFMDVLGDVCEQFQALHPQVQLEMILEQKRLRLEHGQAHIAVRAGPRPDEGDYIAQHLAQLNSGLYANQRYINKYGIWLIGYDGQDKSHSTDISLLKEIYNIIDKMPIRKREMSEQNKKCN